MDVIPWQYKKNPLFKKLIDNGVYLFPVEFAHQLPPGEAIIIQPYISAKHLWNDVDVDFAQYIPKRILQSNTYIIFDSSAEAMCPKNEIAYWRAIENNCAKYNINPKRIIYLSCNLLDYNTADTVKPKFWVYAEIFWQNQCLHDWNLQTDVDAAFEAAVKRTTKNHTNKYFSSLNKNNQRPPRSYLNYLLIQGGLEHCGLISQNKIPQDQQKYLDFDIEEFNRELPKHIDSYSDTAGDNNEFSWIFDSTIFHIAQESSQAMDYEKILISEKYFKPIATFTPFIAYGVPKINRLYTVMQGYKIYNNYFDLNLGLDWQVRAKELYKQVDDLCKRLSKMNRNQRIDFKFHDDTTLKHNYRVMLTNQYNNSLREKFLLSFNA